MTRRRPLGAETKAVTEKGKAMKKLEEMLVLGYRFEHGRLNYRYGEDPNEIIEHDTDPYALVIITPDGEKIELHAMLDRPLTVGGIATTRRELIEALFHPSEEDLCQYEFHYGVRTKNYFAAVLSDIGMLSYTEYSDMYDPAQIPKFEAMSTMQLTANCEIKIGEYGEGRYIIEYIVPCNIDSYILVQMVFDHYPSREDITTAIEVESTKKEMRRHGNEETYKCRGCGRTLHWLDVDGSFDVKRHSWREKHCDC